MMKWMACRPTRQQIDQAESGQQLSAQAQRHVESCASCGAFQHERTRLRELLASLDPVTAPADFDFRLRARIAAQKDRAAPRSLFSSFVLSPPAISVVTVLVVVLGLSIVWIQRHGVNQPSTVAENSSNQVREGNSTTADNPPSSKQADVPDSTITANSMGNSNPDAPIYLARGRKPQIKNPGSTQPVRYSRDLSEGSAPSIKQGQNATDVSVTAPLNPMVLSFQDEKGATRRVSLPPVSFGSQRLLESRVVPVSLTNGRVW